MHNKLRPYGYLGTFEEAPFWYELYETKEDGVPVFTCKLFKQAQEVGEFKRSTRSGIDSVIQSFVEAANTLVD